MADLTNAVKFYFSLGFNHSEIFECLARINGVVLSLSSLRADSGQCSIISQEKSF